MTEKIKRYLFLFIGFISLALGVIGVVFPILPTTPFLLLTAYCFARSSKRLYQWMLNNKIFGEYLRNYLTYRAISRRTKITTMILLWITLGISICISDSVHLKIFLCAVGIGVSIHLIKLKELGKVPVTQAAEERLPE